MVRSYHPVSVRDLSGWIKTNFFLDLSSASFKRDDEALYPKAGPCITCQKRTGHTPALFDDLKGKDHCLDSKCFNHKLDAMIERGQQELEGEDHLEVYQDWVNNPQKDALKPHNWTECKKKDKGAKRALILNGKDRGRITYAKKPERVSGQRFENPEEEAKWKKEQHERQLNNATNQILSAKIHDKLILQYKLAEKKWDTNIFLCLIPLVADFIYDVDWDQLYGKYGVELPETYDDSQLHEALANLPLEDLEMLNIEIIIRGLNFSYGEVVEESQLFAWAKNRGIKVKDLQKSAKEEAEKKLAEEEKKEPEKNDEA